MRTSDTGELLEKGESVLEHLAVKLGAGHDDGDRSRGDVLAELEELGGLLEAHVIEEEQNLFPKVSHEMDEGDLRQLGVRMNEMVEQLRRERAPRMHVPEGTEEPAPI